MLAYAGYGAIRRRHHEEQAEQTWCLALATNAVVTWTTGYNGLPANADRHVAPQHRLLRPPRPAMAAAPAAARRPPPTSPLARLMPPPNHPEHSTPRCRTDPHARRTTRRYPAARPN
jgi:hypothetical protein